MIGHRSAHHHGPSNDASAAVPLSRRRRPPDPPRHRWVSRVVAVLLLLITALLRGCVDRTRTSVPGPDRVAMSWQRKVVDRSADALASPVGARRFTNCSLKVHQDHGPGALRSPVLRNHLGSLSSRAGADGAGAELANLGLPAPDVERERNWLIGVRQQLDPESGSGSVDASRPEAERRVGSGDRAAEPGRISRNPSAATKMSRCVRPDSRNVNTLQLSCWRWELSVALRSPCCCCWWPCCSGMRLAAGVRIP